MKQNFGTTLIETLISFTILLIIASIIPLFMHHKSPSQGKFIQKIEVAIFFQQIADEINQSSEITVNNHVLSLKKETEEVNFILSSNSIRRQVRFKGNEIVLQNIQSVIFQPWENGVYITITDLYGQRFEQIISHILSLEAMKIE